MAIVTIRGQKGGGGLNYSVKAYAAAADIPAAGKTNEIAVITSTAIGVHTFSAAQPTTRADGTALQAGDVWFVTGIQSNFPFNALKKNGLIVCGQSAFQYSGSAWTAVTAKIYYNGAWVDWALSLYFDGDECTDVTGGWSTMTDGVGSASKNADHILLSTGSGTSSGKGFCTTVTLVDLTTINTIKVLTTCTANSYVGTTLGVGSGSFGYSEASVSIVHGTLQETSLDVSALTGYHYVTVWMQSGSYNSVRQHGSMQIYRVWGEA